ncbi:MAG: FAD:protein FMN transferase [candidate division WOR-3 bacterium]|nr:FAD:protein FMN transferase [candidate division WOR-3 bacterium]
MKAPVRLPAAPRRWSIARGLHDGLLVPVGLFAAAAAVVLLAAGCRRPEGVTLRKQTRLMMDTYVTIEAAGPVQTTDKAIEAAFERLEEISHKFNFLDSTSPVHAFNFDNVPLTDSEVVEVVRAAVAVSEVSGGAFDITVRPLVELWGFYGDHPAVPSQRAIDSCLKMVGYKNLLVEPGRVTKLRPDVTIDLGGIAKGYGLGEAARVLRAHGVDSALIDLGGDIYAMGKKGNKNWKVGIRNPRGDGVVGIAAVSNLAVVTSGDYERYFFGPPRDTIRNRRTGTVPGTESAAIRYSPRDSGHVPADSVRYCHIIDPATGWPARGMISTTIVMRDPLTAQGWSKILFLRGTAALPLVEKTGGMEALLIDDSMKAFCTPGLASALDSTLLNGITIPRAGK